MLPGKAQAGLAAAGLLFVDVLGGAPDMAMQELLRAAVVEVCSLVSMEVATGAAG